MSFLLSDVLSKTAADENLGTMLSFFCSTNQRLQRRPMPELRFPVD